MAKIMVEIDCKKRFCGDCCLVQFHESEIHPFCSYFGGTLPETWNESKNEWNPLKRLPECIAAEIPEGYSTATFKALTRFYEETKGLKPLTNDPAEVKEEYDVVF